MSSRALEEELARIEGKARTSFAATTTLAGLDAAKAEFLGKSGSLTELLKSLGKLPTAERPAAGAAINPAQASVQAPLQARRRPSPAHGLEPRRGAEAIDIT